MAAKELELGSVRAALADAAPAGFNGTVGNREPSAKVGKNPFIDMVRGGSAKVGKAPQREPNR